MLYINRVDFGMKIKNGIKLLERLMEIRKEQQKQYKRLEAISGK